MTPLKIEVDFSRLLPSGVLVDPHSIYIQRYFDDGSEERIPVYFSESLYYSNQGYVAIPVRDPHRTSRWELLFKGRGRDGCLSPFPEYIPPVGIRDELMLNGTRLAL